MSDWLYGRNAVREALRAGRRRVTRLLLASNTRDEPRIREITGLAAKAGVPVERVERRDLDRQTQGANHQGLVLATAPYPYVALDAILEQRHTRDEPAWLLLLDHVQDPQNLGTLLRTAEAVGIHGVVLPERRAAGVTAAVVNSSSGATEHLLIAQVTNLAQTMRTLRDAGVWLAGLAADQQAWRVDRADFVRPLALVVGAEGSGLARLTREHCDFLVQIPMRGQVESLNAAVAGSIVLYQVWQQRGIEAV